MRTHKTEFPTVTIPVEILALVEAGKLKDESWHNDTSPSFRVNDSVVLWVEHEDIEQREMGGKRFSVFGQDDLNEGALLFDTDKLDELLFYLKDHWDLEAIARCLSLRRTLG